MTSDTKTIVLHQDDISFPNDEEFDWSHDHVVLLVQLAMKQSNIGLGEQRNFRNFGVQEIVSGVAYSKAAYIESDSGYFIISEDMMLHINVTFSRWD